MAVIQSGADTTKLLTIDGTSLAARTTLYDGAGNALHPNYTGLFSGSIQVAQTATTGATVTVWAIWNNTVSTTTVVTNAYTWQFFTGTAVATVMKYEWFKATGVTAFSGGSAVTAFIKRGTTAPANTTIRVLDTGLTLTGSSFGGSLSGQMVQGRVTQTTAVFSTTQFNFNYANIMNGGIELAYQEALCLRLVATAVINDNVNGFVQFYEK